jgi:cytochrome c553
VKRSVLLFTLPFIAFTFLSLVFFQKSCNYALRAEAQKKLPFNHKNHLSNKQRSIGKDNCEYCHKYDSKSGRFLGIPTVKTCVECHDRKGNVKSNDPNEPLRKPMFDKYKNSDKPWGTFAKQTDLVYFSHKVVMTAVDHNGKKRARCGSCHGDKANNSVATTMIKGKMLMGQCEDCHTALRISNKCAVCHD